VVGEWAPFTIVLVNPVAIIAVETYHSLQPTAAGEIMKRPAVESWPLSRPIPKRD
jgi:hypothetical protein